MRLNAYVLAGDPAWVGESISSYYAAVNRIFVSFDRSYRSWTGVPMSVAEALRRIDASDPEGKVVLLPGDHVAPGQSTIRSETNQRQSALEAASSEADWVLQLDADEIALSFERVVQHLHAAEARGAEVLDYPLRDVYARVNRTRFLEHCGRFWTAQAAYPGPIAVRAGTTLSNNRQVATRARYRVDLAPWNTDPAHPSDAAVHAVVAQDDAVLHLSWVRSEAQMQEKRLVSGYAANRDWDRDLERWRWRARHPWLAASSSPFSRNPFDRYRLTTLPELADREP